MTTAETTTADLIPIDSVLPGESPRFTAEDEAHAARLAETDAELPPILVHRPTMRVIDGAHRLLAARLRGEQSVAVEYFDGSAEAAYVLAVETNVAHGLPLSIAERKAAAQRIIRIRPELSDRSIARSAGLSAKTVGEIRRRSTDGAAQSNTRIGRDGRLRPVNPDEGRQRVLQVINERPGASLREIAQAAGVSLGTAHGVRTRVDRGEDPVHTRAARNLPAAAAHPAHAAHAAHPTHAAVASTRDGAGVGRAGHAATGVAAGTCTCPGRGPAAHQHGPGGTANGERPGQGTGQGGSLGASRVPAEAPATRAPSPRIPAQRGRTVQGPDQAVRRIGPRRLPNGGRPATEAYAGLARLRRDPSLRFTDNGRALLIWLHRRLVTVSEAERELQEIPMHLLPVVADLALECAEGWRQLADELRGRARQIG